MPRGKVTEALLEHRETHEKNDRSDGCLAHEGANHSKEADPGDEQVHDPVDEAVGITVVIVPAGFKTWLENRTARGGFGMRAWKRESSKR